MLLLDFNKQNIHYKRRKNQALEWAHILTFLCRPARKLCQAQGQLPMWRSTERGYNQDFSNKSTTASIGRIWTGPMWTESTEWEKRDLLTLLVESPTLLLEPWFVCARHIMLLAPKPKNFSKSRKCYCFYNLQHIILFLLIQGWRFVMLSKINSKSNFGCNRACFQHPCCWVLFLSNFIDSRNCLQ